MTIDKRALTPAQAALLFTELGVAVTIDGIRDRQLLALLEHDRVDLSPLERELAMRLAAAHHYIDQILAQQSPVPGRGVHGDSAHFETLRSF